MVWISDEKIINAIKSLIEGDSRLFDNDTSVTDKLNHVFDEPLRDGVLSPYSNYAEIIPPLQDEVERVPEEEPLGGYITTKRPFHIIATFKQLSSSNNTRLLAVPSNFRKVIADNQDLGITGVREAIVVPYGYAVNEDDQTVVDLAIMTVEVLVDENY